MAHKTRSTEYAPEGGRIMLRPLISIFQPLEALNDAARTPTKINGDYLVPSGA